ncbi:tyrosine-protein phosphatase [Streptomyces sp. NPDC050560]|uniref:tyrosine-protein phosphatase n=1 Tax=Streptomyces sp. NPDC050560 TaxID=3365630 RepID=UPI00379EB7C6
MSQQDASWERELAGVRNFRDVGGLPAADGRRLRYGLLFRSGHLAGATTDDVAYLSSLGLHTVYDFRNEADRTLDGLDVELPGVRNVNIPLNDPADGAEFWRMVRRGDLDELRETLSGDLGGRRMLASYRTIVTERTAEHGRILREVATESVPVLLHCAAGKDRAGVSVAVILLALGVEREAIEEDYLRSNALHRRYRLGRPGSPYSPEVRALLTPLFEARAEYLAAAFETIDATWGGTEAYLSDGLGLTPALRERLRAGLLDG